MFFLQNIGLFLSLVLPAQTEEIPFENLPAYRSIVLASPCVTNCATQPSKAFKEDHHCDPSDPSVCICGNATASVELESSMVQYCANYCGATWAPMATTVLSQYCSTNMARLTNGASSTSSSSTLTAGINALTSASPSPTEGSSAYRGNETGTSLHLGLDLGLGLGLGLGIGLPLLGAVLYYLLCRKIDQVRTMMNAVPGQNMSLTGSSGLSGPTHPRSH
jgi:hypothetical protein